MKYIEMMQKEMNEVLEQLKPHFEGYGELEIDETVLDIELVNGKRRDTVIFFREQSIDNKYRTVYDNLPFTAEDVFEEVGPVLKELKIKPVPKFDVNEWKKGFAKRHNLDIIENGTIRNNKGEKIINKHNDTSFNLWHNSIFKNKHKKFNFKENALSTFLKTKEDCEEFERIYIIINNYLNNLPGLNKEI